MKLLTLAVASYNMEQYLDRCLESVTGHNIPDTLEVIVVNDGSKDTTTNIAHVYQKLYPHIVRVIDKENGHYGSCINKAIENATGKYFRPLDADDWVNTDNLIQLLHKLESCDADLFVTEFSIYKVSGVESNALPANIIPEQVYDAKTFDVERQNCTALFAMHGMTYRTEVLREAGVKLHTGIHYTDTEYILLPLDHIHTITFFNLDLYQYNMMREGQSIQKSIQYMSIGSFYLLSSSLLKNYLERCQLNNTIVCSNQRCILRRVLYYFFVSALVYGNIHDAKTKQMLFDIFDLVSRNKDLMADSLSFRYKGLSFVKYWYKYNFRIFSLIPKSMLY